MENLAPINIITRDNNSGKTSVLELLQSVKKSGQFQGMAGIVTEGQYRSSTWVDIL